MCVCVCVCVCVRVCNVCSSVSVVETCVIKEPTPRNIPSTVKWQIKLMSFKGYSRSGRPYLLFSFKRDRMLNSLHWQRIHKGGEQK